MREVQGCPSSIPVNGAGYNFLSQYHAIFFESSGNLGHILIG